MGHLRDFDFGLCYTVNNGKDEKVSHKIIKNKTHEGIDRGR
jgi:hypothetical protein